MTSRLRQVFSRLVVASGLLTLACATAIEEGPLVDDLGGGTGGTTSNSAGSHSTAGTTSSSAGTLVSAGTTSTSGGKGGTGATAFGGTATSGGTGGTSKGGTSSGGAAAGSASGGKAGTANGGNASAGTATGGSGSAGAASGGSGTAGSTSATCNGLANWTSKTYAVGDTVASTCSGVFAAGCAMGQSHKFECNPTAGTAALPWCMSREPGVGNGWGEAWLDKGKCQ